MLRIAICDDTRDHRISLRDVLTNILFEQVEFEVDLFSDGVDILNLLEEDMFHYDLLFLDIQMPVVDGLEAARAIRESRLSTDIIFFTAHAEHVYEGFVYKAFSYLVKPVSTAQLSREMNRYLAERERSGGKCVILYADGYYHKIGVGEIDYIVSDKRKVTVYAGRECIEAYMKLSELLDMADSPLLVRVHQSYVVNADRIRSLGKNQLICTDRTVIPVSKKYYASTRDVFYRQAVQK